MVKSAPSPSALELSRDSDLAHGGFSPCAQHSSRTHLAPCSGDLGTGPSWLACGLQEPPCLHHMPTFSLAAGTAAFTPAFPAFPVPGEGRVGSAPWGVLGPLPLCILVKPAQLRGCQGLQERLQQVIPRQAAWRAGWAHSLGPHPALPFQVTRPRASHSASQSLWFPSAKRKIMALASLSPPLTP